MGRWQPLNHEPPVECNGIATMLLLTDGRVMALDGHCQAWCALAPDPHGSYLNGTWSPLASMQYYRQWCASAVLADGTVFVAGGEESDAGPNTNTGEVYDPLANTWTPLPLINTFPDLESWDSLGDAPCCVLADGRVLVGRPVSSQTALYDPATQVWMRAADKSSVSAEETWTLLADGSVLTIDCYAFDPSEAERYIPGASPSDPGQWVSAGQTPAPMVDLEEHEIGPAMLLPDRRVFAIGGTGNTAIYAAPPPGSMTERGTWAPGPAVVDAMGNVLRVKDAPACLLTNGHVLFIAGPENPDMWAGPPIYFFEFDPTSMGVPEVASPSEDATHHMTTDGRMLVVPTGEVLFSNYGRRVYLYNYEQNYPERWRPTIREVAADLVYGNAYTLYGTQLNGLSQAASYGDDAAMATNYPLIRITYRTGHTRYCRTFKHSTMAVATGADTLQHTTFELPGDVESGSAMLSVVANGIPSESVPVHIYAGYLPPAELERVVIISGSLDGEIVIYVPGRGIVRHGPGPSPTSTKFNRLAEEGFEQIRAGLARLETAARTVLDERLAELQSQHVWDITLPGQQRPHKQV